MQIQKKPPLAIPFELIGGEEKVRALVVRFYDMMAWSRNLDCARPMAPSSKTPARTCSGSCMADYAGRSTTSFASVPRG